MPSQYLGSEINMPWLLRQYQRVFRLSNWGRQRFTFTGHVLLILMVAAAAFGVNTKESTCYQLFVLLLMVISISLILSRFKRYQIEFKRELPNCATVGEPVFYRVTLRSPHPHPIPSARLFEQLVEPDDTPSRFISYRHWLRQRQHRRGGTIPNIQVNNIHQQSTTISIGFTPTHRGTLSFAESILACPDLLGLSHTLVRFKQAQTLLILPKHYPIPPLNLDGARKYQAGGVALASSVGNSSEFMSLRDYQRGDPLNSIHWKSYAKHGKLIVKEYQDEYFVRRALILDTFIGDAPAEQFEAAVSVAASLAISEQQNDALLDLMFVGQQVYCFTSGRSVDHLPHMQEILANVQPSPSTAFEQLQQAVVAHGEHCSSLVCVLMHWDHTRQQFIQQLQMLGLPVAVLVLHNGTLTEQACPQRPECFYLIDYNDVAGGLAQLSS